MEITEVSGILITGALIPLSTLLFNFLFQKSAQKRQHQHELEVHQDQKEYDIRKDVTLNSISVIAKSHDILLNAYSKNLDEFNSEISSTGLGQAMAKLHLVSSLDLIEAVLNYSREFTKVLQNTILLLAKRDSIRNSIAWLEETIELKYQSVQGLTEDYQAHTIQEAEKLSIEKNKLESKLFNLNTELSKSVTTWSFDLVPFTNKALFEAKKDLGFKDTSDIEKYENIMSAHLKAAKESQKSFMKRLETTFSSNSEES